MKKPLVLCGHIPSLGTYRIWFWNPKARTYCAEMPFEAALNDPRFQTYVANAIRKDPMSRERSEKTAIEIAQTH
jgi:hypothetical protein